MAHEQFIDKRFQRSTMEVIDNAVTIIDEYLADGYSLTLRQLYYQFVSRALLPNTSKSYDRLGAIINNARLAGLIDWAALEDRTRNLAEYLTFVSPVDAIESVASTYIEDVWGDQPAYLELWVEKEALAGVFDRVCGRYRVPHLACKGYVSQSEMYGASKRFIQMSRTYGKDIHIIHFGDHDPSGIDMTRDIEDRLRIFGAHKLQVHRLALNMDQVRKHNPPPNPAKVTDSRFQAYEEEYGDESWELDALNPKTLNEIAEEKILEILDGGTWDESIKEEKSNRAEMHAASEQWDNVRDVLEIDEDSYED